MNKNISQAQLCLTVLSVVALLVSNIAATKQFLLPLGISMTGGAIVFPITYILSDLFSEVYGYKWSRITCYIGFAMNLFMVIVFQMLIVLPPSPFFLGQEAFALILGNTPRMLAASLAAFVIGDFVNDRVFRKLKDKADGMKGFAGRAILSSLCGEIVDSAIFITVALAGVMPIKTLLIMGVTQVTIKVAYEIIIVPVTTAITRKVKTMEMEGTYETTI